MASKNVLIAYGSHSGKAIELADQIQTELICLNLLSVQKKSMNDLLHDTLKPFSILIFVCSTTGQGEFPDNAKMFWRYLLNKILPKILTNVFFTIFGLGDSSYERFNWASKKLEKRILQLGGTEILPTGIGDEQDELGIEGGFSAWLAQLINLFEKLLLRKSEMCMKPSHIIEIRDSLSLNSWKIKSSTLSAQLVKKKRITSVSHWQDVQHIHFKPKFSISTSPGDVASLRPYNNDEVVHRIICSLKWEIYEQHIILDKAEPVDEKNYIPSLFNTIKYELDIQSPPRRRFFEVLCNFYPPGKYKDRLEELCSLDKLDEFHDYVTRPRRSPLEILSDFPNAQVPITYLKDLFMQIKPRKYSIANSRKKGYDEIHICVAILKYKTSLKESRIGYCSDWLNKLKIGDDINLSIEEGSEFKRIENSATMLMIATGTGIAPIRSFIQQRLSEGYCCDLLIFGFRNARYDFLYEQELLAYANAGQIKILTAQSQTDNKYYIQDCMRANSHLVFEYISNENNSTLICGRSGKMPKAVKEALIDIYSQESLQSHLESELYITKLCSKGKLVQESW